VALFDLHRHCGNGEALAVIDERARRQIGDIAGGRIFADCVAKVVLQYSRARFSETTGPKVLSASRC
jgi:hypothetical protein